MRSCGTSCIGSGWVSALSRTLQTCSRAVTMMARRTPKSQAPWVRKRPEIFFRSLVIRRSRSASLLVNAMCGSVRKRRHPSLFFRNRNAKLRPIRRFVRRRFLIWSDGYAWALCGIPHKAHDGNVLVMLRAESFPIYYSILTVFFCTYLLDIEAPVCGHCGTRRHRAKGDCRVRSASPSILRRTFVAIVVEHGEQFVRRPESTRSEVWHASAIEHFELFGRVGV